MLSSVLLAGLKAVGDYVALHVLTCLIPAFLLAGALVAFISKEAIMERLGAGASKVMSFPAAEIIPQADVLALSGTTLINHSFEALVALRRPDALVVVLGPSTPLSPILFRHGVHVISGAVVTDIDAVMRTVRQGANFQQVRRHGVRLVTMRRR